MSIGIPAIPPTAPFSESQRNWLNGYIAALQSGEYPVSKSYKERVLIIYASQSGNSEALAEDFGKRLANAGFGVQVLPADEYEVANLTNENWLLLVTSTWGEGDPPDNAIEFREALHSEEMPVLPNLKYSVLGLGDTNYIDFCAMGKAFDSQFEKLGATRFSPRADCDTDYEETAEIWFEKIMSELGTAESPAIDPAPSTDLANYSKKNPFPSTLTVNQKLNSEGSERDTRHFEFSLKGSGLEYQVGDVLAVYPENDLELLNQILYTLKLEPTSEQLHCLVSDYDICTISTQIINAWKPYCSGAFPLSDTQIAEYAANRQLIDLVCDFPALFANTDELIALLRKLGPRLYSISSSPKTHPEEVHLTIARVEYQTFDRTRKGVCSTWLSDRVTNDDKVRVFLQTVKHFKLPVDPTTPIIMVGPGTGVAPFRAFLEEREITMSPGENWLFFGNPHQQTDWFYKHQFNAMVESGHLTNYHQAWSRDQAQKIYVQDHIRENGAEVWEWIDQNGSHIYVCGDAKRMAKDVDAALHWVVETYGKMTPIAAGEYVNALKKDQRYQRDVY